MTVSGKLGYAVLIVLYEDQNITLSNSQSICAVVLMYIGISPYRTLAVVWTVMYDSYVMCDLIGWEYTNSIYFSCDMGKYSTRSLN